MDAAVLSGFPRGQVLVEVDKPCAGNVGLGIGAAAGFGIGEIVPAVADDPSSVVQARREIADGNERVEHFRIQDPGFRVQFTPVGSPPGAFPGRG